MPMSSKIVIAGGNGFLGSALAQYFNGKGIKIILLARKPVQTRQHSNVKWVYWDGEKLNTWSKELEGADVLINLAGKNVSCRYTPENKRLIYDSRLKSTHILGEAIKQCIRPPSLWINASSATIYRASYDKLMSEKDGETGDDFSMDVCKKWEAEFNRQHVPGVRKIIIRTSIVLGNGGGAMPPLRNLVRFGLGGKQGKGNQYCSWIHIGDFCRVIKWMIENQDFAGVYNVTAPLPLPNVEFMKTLRQAMKMPVGLIAPEWLLRIGAIFIRTEPELILKSRKVYPKRLLDEGFVFEFSDIKAAMENLCQKRKTIL
jgi:uncharacterized protein